MAKITLQAVSSGYLSATQLNANFTAIAAAFENTLSRDGTTPNTMSADFDMNSNHILNLPDPTLSGHAVNLNYLTTNYSTAALTAATAAAAASAAAAATSETNAATSETNAATSETNAATSETNAAASEAAAAASAAALPTVTGPDAGKVLSNDGTDLEWIALPGGGDVTGPGSSVDGGLVVFSGTTGKVLRAHTGSDGAATDSTHGVVELATSAETITGTDTARAVTPAGLQAKTASDTAIGLVELATSAEAITGTDTARAVTPSALQAKLDNDVVKLTGTQNIGGVKNLTDVGTIVDVNAGTAYTIGYRDVPQYVRDTTHTFTLTDRGKSVGKTLTTARTYTIPPNSTTAFPLGACITVFNNAASGNITVAQGAGVTLYNSSDASSGNMTCPPRAILTLLKVATDTWFGVVTA